MSHQSETELVTQCRAGDREAFDALVRLHQQQVYAVAMRMLADRDEAEDVAQDVFVRAYRAIGTFRGGSKVSTWLVAITMNLCRNRRRWWGRRRRVIAGSLDEPVAGEETTVGERVADPAAGPDEDAARHERQRMLMDTLQLLDEPSRSVIVLRDIQGYSYEEIAQMLHLRVGTVKSRINRARLQLRALLDGKL